MIRRLAKWIDEQTGFVSLLIDFMDEPLAEKVGWPHVLGSAVAFVFGLQLITGGAMMVYYVATPDHAYSTIQFMQQLAFGRLVRGLHHFGATAMVVLVGLHLIQVYVWGAYKRPRQVVWVIGCALLMLVFAFSFTGYLLPWDQKAYWATVVGTNIAGSIPHIGHVLRSILRAGEHVGAATLTRFFSLHVFFLPAVTAMLIGFHIFQVRHHGIAPPWAEGEPEDLPKPQRFYPDQVFKDAVFAFIVLVVLLVAAWRFGAPLEPMADPSDTHYLPRPEWYFLPLYQLLKYLPGKYGEFVGAIVLPGIAFTALMLLPYVDHNPRRLVTKRPFSMATLVVVFAGTTAFGIAGVKSNPPKTRLNRMEQRGEKVFLDLRCHACHPVNGVGGDAAPDLAHADKRDDETLMALLRDPEAFTERSIMPPVDLPPSDMAVLVAFLQRIDEHYELTRTPSVGPKKPTSHYEENWFLYHKFEVRKDPTYCESCHKPHFCKTCHMRRRPDSHLDNWMMHHFGVAAEKPEYCQACHEVRFCDECHERMAHDEQWTDRHGPQSKEDKETCLRCHKERTCTQCHEGARPDSHRDSNWLTKHGRAPDGRCTTCHTTATCESCHTGARPRSHTADWPRTHGKTARRRRQNCRQCHSPSFCNSCHGLPMPHASSFAQTGHQAVAKASPATCARCHSQSTCDECHGLPLPHPQGWRRKPHSEAARETPELCGKCHQQDDCRKCHDEESAPESHYDDAYLKQHGKQSAGREALCSLCHGRKGCDDCHGIALPHPDGWRRKPHAEGAHKTPDVCVKCHQQEDCRKCHDEESAPESHYDDAYLKQHGEQSKGHEPLCVLCHGEKGCDDCHRKNNVVVPAAERVLPRQEDFRMARLLASHAASAPSTRLDCCLRH